MFFGRKSELKRLENAYRSNRSELIAIYGRRRIGKSRLIQQFSFGKPDFFKFEAIEEDNMAEQIKHFTESLRKHTDDPLLADMHFKSWENVFTYITERVVNRHRDGHPLVLFFDEIQWMASGKSKLISIIKYYWDNHWKDHNVMLILCGSIASFMVRSVIKSKALYGRITQEILLKGLQPDEAAQFFKSKRGTAEILKYLLVFGGVPKYLEEINLNASFLQNMNALCFSKDGSMTKELDRIFYSQFREPGLYKRIAILLNENNLSLNDVAKALKMPSGGGLKSYLQNLEDAEIIKSYVPFDRTASSKFKKYALNDEYIVFYFKYIEPNIKVIEQSSSRALFETLTKKSIESWFGFAFERFCIKHAAYIARKLGFEDEMLTAAPYFGKGDRKFQIDIVFKRSDNVITIAEIKHYDREIETSVIPEMERKCALIQLPKNYTLEKALISLHGPDKSLRASGYFNHYLTAEEILCS